jgi:hypothetical protein
MTRNVNIDGSRIVDWDSFHDVFSEALGFPAFYGRNLDAWIDCMTSLDSPEDGMSTVHVSPEDVLVLCISGVQELRKRCPEIYNSLIECAAFVNWRRIELGEQAVLALSFYD